MDEFQKARIIEEAKHIVNTKDTIRKTADKFNLSKSTIHTDLTKRLEKIDRSLYENINDIFKEHDRYKHIRGGEVTKEKYKRG